MYKQSRLCRELFTHTVNLNNEISKLIRQQLVVTDDNQLMFGDEYIKSPGQLGVKIMQLIDYVKEQNPKNDFDNALDFITQIGKS